MTQTEGGRAYGWGWGLFLIHVISLLVVSVTIPAFTVMQADLYGLSARFASNEVSQLLQLSFLSIFFADACWALSLILLALSLFTTRVVVSPDGIEYRSWQYRQRARWSDVERIDIWVYFGLAHKVLYLRQSELTGGRVWLALRRMLSLPPTIMVLSSMFGWPEGPLADDVRRYAPHLFASPALTN